MHSVRNTLFGAVAGAVLIAACGGGDSGGGGGGGGGGGSSPTSAERNAMATALTDAATNAEAAGDLPGAALMNTAAGLIAGGLKVTAVSGVTFSRDGGAAAILGPASQAGNGWAFGVELGIIQSTQPLVVGPYEGALVISGTDIAYGLGLINPSPGYTGSSFGAIWSGSGAGWAATQLTGFGLVDTVIGGDCLPSVPSGYGITMCTRSSHAFPGFNITASAPMNFPGNTAAGSNTMTFAPARLRGASMTLECSQTTFC